MKAEINYKEKTGKKTDTWRLNNMQLNNPFVNEEIRGYKKYSEINEYGNTTFQYLWDTENPKDEVHSIKAYFMKQEKSQIHNLNIHLKKLEKQENVKPKVSRRNKNQRKNKQKQRLKNNGKYQ